jgi:hypothetical protein
MRRLVLLLVLSAGCVRVHPWQRETLARPIMLPEVDPYASAQDETMREITEGATFGGGGPGSAGAGCGCH